MSVFFLSQCLIAIAIVTDILSFQFKHKRHIVLCLALSGILSSLHFALLSQWTAAGLMLVAAIRYLVTVFSHSRRLLWLFLSINSLIALLTFAGPLSLISFAGSCTQTIAAFCRSDQRLRQLMIVGTSIWLVNNYLAGSPTAVLMELLFIGSNLVGYYRFYGLPWRPRLVD
ncbi:YgjV family protein [Shewanella aquimarina]|uniref:YgjV family protein n=1 Tax=Shewanella aquimarina TaxID=260365 RepID=UPI002014DF91|nr:YgjV family protein [Shewanella aquimarina]MCL2908763.1 YgjV family protein [Shewanella aquimarina]